MPVDPVCGAKLEEEEAMTATVEGQTYYFCCDDCMQEFMEAPEEYQPQTVQTTTEEQ